MTEYFAAPWAPPNNQPEAWAFVVKLKTNTAGAGQLLVTLRYGDGEGDQDLNVALNLTAANYAVVAWSDLFVDTTHNLQLAFTYLAPGGTCDVTIIGRP